MKRIKYLILLAIMMVSCGKFLTKKFTEIDNEDYRIYYLSNGNKTAAFIPIVHTNTPRFYARVKRDIDSLRKDGYTVFYENIGINPDLDSISKQVIARKFRKITGIEMSVNLKDRTASQTEYRIKGFVLQTDSIIGIDPKSDSHVDLTMDSLINIYEKDRGKIILNDCDFKTKLTDKYRCAKINLNERGWMIMNYRNKHLANEIMKHKSNKIVVVYGSAHINYVAQNLYARDTLWKYDEEKTKSSAHPIM